MAFFIFPPIFTVPFFFPAGNLGKLGLGVAFSKFPPISAVPFCFPAGKLGKLRTWVVFFKFPPRNQPHAGQTKLFFGDLESRSIFRPNFLGSSLMRSNALSPLACQNIFLARFLASESDCSLLHKIIGLAFFVQAEIRVVRGAHALHDLAEQRCRKFWIVRKRAS